MKAGKLRADFEAALAAESERVGPAFLVEPVVDVFGKREGAPHRATLYRWAKVYRESGRVGAHLTTKVREATAARAARTAEPAKGAAEALVAALPVPLRPDELAGAGGPVALVAELHDVMAAARQILRQTRGEDGRSIRLTKTALAAIEATRRCIATAVQLAEAMRQVSHVDEFHHAVVEEVCKLAPETAEALLQRLHHLTANWNAAGGR